MDCNEMQNAKKYLCRFNKILNQMANKMLSARMVNNITLDFIRCMIPHHQAAIYMCENLLDYTNYPPLQEIAGDIIKTQTAGIEQMRQIAKTTCGFDNCRCDVCNYYFKYLQITKNMIYKMRNSPRCSNINLDFINEMIPHHEGAIAMCHNLLQYCIDSRLKEVAENIIVEQSEGVEKLKKIRDCLCKIGSASLS